MADTRGTTETVGVILMTAVMVIAVSGAAGALFFANTPIDQPRASIEATVTESNLTVEHVGGEPIESSAIEFALSGTNRKYVPADAIDGSGDGDELFEPGESLTFALDGTVPDEVTLIYVADRRVVVDSASVSTA